MKNNFSYVAFLAFILMAHSGLAQQNLFNIPSGDITPRKQFFYQHQFNFYAVKKLESKSHLVYGLGKKWDAGINLVDLPLNLGADPIISINDNINFKPLYPLLMFTLQKQFVLKKDHLLINIGTQIGPNLSGETSNMQVATNSFAVARWHVSKYGYLIGGPYHTNDVYVGGPPENYFGFMLGYEYKLSDRWLLMGDFISGDHKKSQTVIGGGYNVSRKFQIFLGALVTFPNDKLDRGIVVEINWYGWDFNETDQSD